MKDYAKRIFFPEGAMPKIKGHTRIELTKVATGEKKIIEHDNVFQSTFLSKFFRSMGAYNNGPYVNAIWAGRPLFRNLCGGILLFRDEIQAPAEYMPAGNKMVANASYGVTNNGTPAELGSYNSIESSTSGSNSISFVYDWGTSQGNGTISCVCLTSDICGRIGYGNPSGDRMTTEMSIDANQNKEAQNGFPYKGFNYRFAVNTTAKTLNVTRWRLAMEEASVFDKNEQPEQSYNFSIQWTTAHNLSVVYMGGGKAAILPLLGNDGIDPGDSYSFLVYDFENKSISEKTITNTSGKKMALAYNIRCRAAATETHLYGLVPTSTYSANTNATDIVGINIETSAAVVIEKPQTDATNIYRISPDLLMCGGHLIDLVNNTSYITNGAAAGQYVDVFDAFIYTAQESGRTNNAARTVHRNPMFLATINNLDNAVTKDSTQTMKVIYTLTEASA